MEKQIFRNVVDCRLITYLYNQKLCKPLWKMQLDIEVSPPANCKAFRFRLRKQSTFPCDLAKVVYRIPVARGCYLRARVSLQINNLEFRLLLCTKVKPWPRYFQIFFSEFSDFGILHHHVVKDFHNIPIWSYILSWPTISSWIYSILLSVSVQRRCYFGKRTCMGSFTTMSSKIYIIFLYDPIYCRDPPLARVFIAYC